MGIPLLLNTSDRVCDDLITVESLRHLFLCRACSRSLATSRISPLYTVSIVSSETCEAIGSHSNQVFSDCQPLFRCPKLSMPTFRETNSSAENLSNALHKPRCSEANASRRRRGFCQLRELRIRRSTAFPGPRCFVRQRRRPVGACWCRSLNSRDS